jgi:uncharacterized membrane protein YdjX (TVP38/TMEM64 family)
MKKKIIVFCLLCAVLLTVYFSGVGKYLTLDAIKHQQDQLSFWVSAHPFVSVALYFLVYIAVITLLLPGAALLTLLAGALFGFWEGVILVSFASTIGASFAFLISRYLIKDWVETKWGSKLEGINQGIKKEGAIYLLGLRLVPVIPFFLINMMMSLTAIRLRTFYWASQIGMLPGTMVYVNAGTQLSQLENTSEILSLPIIVSFVLLALLPIISKKIYELIR